MLIKNSKVAIIGAGNVGVTTAFCLQNQGLCDEIILIDINRDKELGEVLDLNHAGAFMNRNVKISVGDYKDCKDADIVVMTASAPMAITDNDRLKMLEKSQNIVKSVVDSVMESGFEGIFIVVSNPVDIMTYYTWKISGLPKNQVIGSGTTLDTARLKYYLAKRIDVDPRSVEAFVIGEHGDSELVSWSTVTVGGKDFESIVRDNKERVGVEPYDSLEEETIKGGWEIFHKKGNTSYGIAASVAGIVKTILHNENRILPVSTLLSGEYNEHDIFISVPAIIDRQGVKEIVELNLTEEEQRNFDNSCKIVRDKYKELNF